MPARPGSINKKNHGQSKYHSVTMTAGIIR
jgi:hypothetical protein